MRKLLLSAALLLLAPSAHAAPEAVSTFHSIGITWAGSGGGATTACQVRYRIKGDATWSTGYPLWFDPRAVGGRPGNEYRGSIVNLRAGTTYEIELTPEGKTPATIEASTWKETFPIGTTTKNADSSATLTIKTSGTKDGYALYEGGTIDVANKADHNIVIDASFVIIRGMTLKGAATSAIELGVNAHDVIIENSDISGWGKVASDGWGQGDGAVQCINKKTVDRIIMQRNKIHHPRTDANNWEEPRPSRGGDPHPWGPQAVVFETCGGNHVFRYNEVYSDADHYFNDAFGGGDNFSFEGYPNRDSDIYGNKISHCWDDGIEAEGANRNVRIWNNYIDQTFVKIAVASTSIGPVYVFRNVANLSRRSHLSTASAVDGEDRGPFLKMGTGDSTYRGGRIFVFHNTILQPTDSKYTNPLGCGAGLEDSGGDVSQVYSRNNILHVWKSSWRSVGDDSRSTTSTYDYDLYNGSIVAQAGQEAKGIKGVPKYVSGGMALDPTSPGFDVALKLPGFNDDFKGAGPDMGAIENGGALPEWGVDAGTTTPPSDGAVTESGTTTTDGAPPDDSSVTPGADGSTPDNDSGTPTENAMEGDTGGCGCETASTKSPPALLLLAAIGLGIAQRRSSLRRRRD
jgi:MYXO-CTERM domain-containing protein